MHEPAPDSEKKGDGKSRMLVMVMLGVIIVSIVAFLILHPDPSGSGHDTPTSSHAPPSK